MPIDGYAAQGRTEMTLMKTFNGKSLLTPKELAEAIGASESSIRRWVDSGDIRVARTAGGHRRITLTEAIRFIRQIEAPVVRPEVLGLGELRSNGVDGSTLSEDERLFEIFQAGDDDAIRSFLVSRYLEGDSLTSLFDGPLLTAIRRVGDLWEPDNRGILIEHRATEICIEAISTLRRLLPPVDKKSPLALGGAPQGDPYQLPSMMAGAILFERGFRDVNFGANTPVDLLGREAIERGASLVWLSVSAPCEPKPLSASLRKLALDLGKHRIQLVLGGRHHRDVAPGHLANVILIQSMTELAGVAAKLIDGRKKKLNRGGM
jgi:excisionase family DNA binding protein